MSQVNKSTPNMIMDGFDSLDSILMHVFRLSEETGAPEGSPRRHGEYVKGLR